MSRRQSLPRSPRARYGRCSPDAASRQGRTMPLCRRRVLGLAAAAVALPALAQHVRAQAAYPSKPLRWIVGFPPGGGADVVVRIMAPWLAERLGHPLLVENKPGASTRLSLQTVANAPPDGYTLLFYAASATLNVSLYDNLPFN